MKSRIILSIATAFIFINAIHAQRVKNEKYEFKYKKYAAVQLPEALISCKSNHHLINFSDVPASENPDYTLDVSVFNNTKHQNYWGESLINPGNRADPYVIMSTPIQISLINKAGDTEFTRIYQYFDKQETSQFDPEKLPLNARYYTSMHLDVLFKEGFSNDKLKLFYIKKSDEHKDINDAYNKAVDALDLFNEEDFKGGEKLLQEAVGVWEKALEESDMDNRKSRINKKVTEALYINLISVLPHIGRSEDARKLLDKYNTMFTGFSTLYPNSRKNPIKHLAINHNAKANNSDFTLKELEVGDYKVFTKSDKTFTPGSVNEIENLIAGSWYETYGSYELPEKEDKSLTITQDPCKEMIIHLMPNGKDIIQTGSFELDGCKQEFDHSMSLWKVKQEQESGDYYLLMAETEEDFQDQFAVSMFKIVHLDKDYLIIRSPYFDDRDTTTEGYVQLKRTHVMF